ncbi:MAG TPA: hypothetical protein VMF52_11905 [Steroidobacteraceae bacterium]|nr:hypothetical protein [Steroidobacteraceae bacterium]
MSEELSPQLTELTGAYARDLARCVPSRDLDARVERLVAAPVEKGVPRRRRHAEGPRDAEMSRPGGMSRGAGMARGVEMARGAPGSRRARVPTWALAAGLAGLTAGIGVWLGARLERATAPPLAVSSREPAWPPADFSMWPTDSVALKIPAQFSSHGTLVAVDGRSQAAGTRYWVDIVVSNDGTVRIQNIVPAAEETHVVTQTP